MRTLVAMLMLLVNLAALAEDEAFVTTRILTASSANQIAVAAEEHCKKKGYQVSVAVVDRYGNLLAFVRNPLAGAHTIGVAQDKAYTAASFQGATIELANQLEFLKAHPEYPWWVVEYRCVSAVTCMARSVFPGHHVKKWQGTWIMSVLVLALMQ